MAFEWGINLPSGWSTQYNDNPVASFPIASLLHFFVGMAGPLVGKAVAPKNPKAPWYGTGAVMGLAITKETVYDPIVEGGSAQDAVIDTSMYGLGAATGLAIVLAGEKK